MTTLLKTENDEYFVVSDDNDAQKKILLSEYMFLEARGKYIKVPRKLLKKMKKIQDYEIMQKSIYLPYQDSDVNNLIDFLMDLDYTPSNNLVSIIKEYNVDVTRVINDAENLLAKKKPYRKFDVLSIHQVDPQINPVMSYVIKSMPNETYKTYCHGDKIYIIDIAKILQQIAPKDSTYELVLNYDSEIQKGGISDIDINVISEALVDICKTFLVDSKVKSLFVTSKKISKQFETTRGPQARIVDVFTVTCKM